MKYRSSLSAFLGALLVIPVFCFAANPEGAFTITPGAAYYFFDSARNLDNTGVPNLALAYNFDPRWAIEGDVGVINTNQDVAPNYGVHGMVYALDGVFRFAPYCLAQPYLTAGFNVINLSENQGHAPNQVGINGGVGAQIFMDKAIALRGEVRDVFTFMQKRNDIMLMLGVSFLFGGEPDAQPTKLFYKGEGL